MNIFKHRGLFFGLTLTLFSFGCQREIQQELDKAQGPKVAAQTVETYISRGYEMTVASDNVHAVVTSHAVPIPPKDEDQLITYGPGILPFPYSGELFRQTDQNGNELTYQLLENPKDGQTYWAVPFDKTKKPIKVIDHGNELIVIGLLFCACGNNTSACYPVGTGCGTQVCASCTSGVIIIIIDLMVTHDSGFDPYTLVTAESVEFNGTIYQ